MRILNCFSVLVLLLGLTTAGHTQQAAAVDSIRLAIKQAKSIEEKVYWMDNLSRVLMNVNLKESDEVGKELIAVAEESRNRRLMIEAYMSNGARCSYFAGSQDYTTRSIDYYNKALSIARQSKLDDAVGAALLRLSSIHLVIPDNVKAMNYVTQAFSIISTLNNDSLRAESHNGYGMVYLANNDKIAALQNFFSALRVAEAIKKPGNPSLLRTCYKYLSAFYSEIEDYDKAIDYSVLAYQKLDEIKEKSVPYQRAIDMNNIGKLYAAKKSPDIAIDYYKKSLAIAEQMKFPTLKIPAYSSIMEQYMQMNQPQKALEYFNSAEGKTLRQFLYDFGFSGTVDLNYAGIYTKLEQYDSAGIYFNRAASFYEKSNNQMGKMFYYLQLAWYMKKTNNYPKSIEYFHKVKEIADKIGTLEYAERAVKNLDSLYVLTGDYRQANVYNSIYFQYKDSIETLKKEKELAQVEAGDEQLRQEKKLREEEEIKRRKNNIQYMAITIGIVLSFLALVVLGMFKVSATTIKMIGFFAFLMFFEFIFLIFKKNIYSITHGEPWKDLLFMIGLAAILLPLHHWIEEKVIHYLTSHNRLTSAGHHIRTKLFRRSKS